MGKSLLFIYCIGAQQKWSKSGSLHQNPHFTISSPESNIFVPNNIKPHDSSLDVKQSAELPPGIPDIELSETEDSIWNELPHREDQAHPTLPPMLQGASVMETPRNVPWSNHPAPSLKDQTPSYSAFGFQRTYYGWRPRHNMFISPADTDFEMYQSSASRKI